MRTIGIDVGTGNIVCAEKNPEGVLEFHKVKDAFFKLDPASFMDGSAMQFGEKMLKQSGANYIKVDGVLYVLGDHAFNFANLFHKECLRPMAKGVLNPREPISALMVRELIRGVAGSVQQDDDMLYFCTPAEPLDAEFDVIYHADTLSTVFAELEYKNVHRMTEGVGVVYSELEDMSFTGIGISMGAGMINVAYCFLGVPVFSFSLSRAGDWIDENAARATNETANVVQSVKEEGVDLTAPKTVIEKAIAAYYKALVQYIVDGFKTLYAQKDPKDLPNIKQPITVVVAGGTSLAPGVVDMLREATAEGFPVPIAEVKHAEEPLFAVAKGLCKAAEVMAVD